MSMSPKKYNTVLSDLTKTGNNADAITHSYQEVLTFDENTNIVLPNGQEVESLDARVKRLTNTPKETIITVKTINDLRSLKINNNTLQVFVLNYYNDSNSGGGQFIVDYNDNTSLDNGGTVIVNKDNVRFKRVLNDYVTPEMFGAIVNNKDYDNSNALQLAFSHPLKCILNSGTYYVSMPIYFGRNKIIQGNGELLTKIIKTSNNNLGFGNRIINGKTMNFDVDAVLIAYPEKSDWYSQNNTISGFSVGYLDTLAIRGIGFYAALICLSNFKNIKTINCAVGIKTVDCWMVTWERVEASADAPWIMGAQDTAWKGNGTSNTFTSCWATTSRGSNNCAWNFYSMQYSTMISCGVDYAGLDGSPINSVFKFVSCTMNLISCGTEKIHAYNLFHVQYSYIKIIGGSYQQIYNKYRVTAPAWSTAPSSMRVLTNSRLSLNGVELDILYNSTTNANTTAFAWVDDNASLIIDSQTTNKVAIEEIVKQGSITFNKLGIYYNNNSQIKIESSNSEYDINTGSTWDRANFVPSISAILTNKSIDTSGYIKSMPKQLTTENLNDLRTLGCVTFSQGTSANSTLDRNYPTTGGGWFIEQISSGTNGVNTNTIQKAYRFDTVQTVVYIRSVSWGNPNWSPWKTISIV